MWQMKQDRPYATDYLASQRLTGMGEHDFHARLLMENEELKRTNEENKRRLRDLEAENQRLKKKARDLSDREKEMIEETKRRTADAFRKVCADQGAKIQRQNRLLKKLMRQNKDLSELKKVNVPGLMALYEDEIECQLNQMDELAKRYHDLLTHVEDGKRRGMICAEFTFDQFYFE